MDSPISEDSVRLILLGVIAGMLPPLGLAIKAGFALLNKRFDEQALSSELRAAKMRAEIEALKQENAKAHSQVLEEVKVSKAQPEHQA